MNSYTMVRIVVFCGILFGCLNWGAVQSSIAQNNCGPLEQEAENGNLYGDFVIGYDNDASGDEYVHVPNDSVDHARDEIDLEQRVEYCFDIPDAGRYAITGIVYAIDGESNSFYVRVDDEPEPGYLWAMSEDMYNQYLLDDVNDREANVDSVVVTLSEGEHTISVYMREDGTRLDTINLELVSLEEDPSFVRVCSDDGDYTSIQDAINAVSAGGTVELCAETFAESITIYKDLTLRGQDAGETLIKPYDNTDTYLANRTVILVSPETDVVIEDLSITTTTTECCGPIGSGIDNRGILDLRYAEIYDNARGLLNQGGDLTVFGSTVRDNNQSYFKNDGAGIQNLDGTLRVIGSIIQGNSMSGPDENSNDGAGIYNDDIAFIIESTIRDNVGAVGGGIYNLGEMTIEDSSILNNLAGSQGGGIYNNGVLSIGETTISENATAEPILGGSCGTQGAGIANYNQLDIKNSEILSNSTGADRDCYGGGILNEGEDALLTMANLTIAGNKAAKGAGIYNSSSLLIEETTISDNASPEAGAGIYNRGALTMRYSAVEDNKSDDSSGGGIESTSDGEVEIYSSTISGNDAILGAGISNSGLFEMTDSTVRSNRSFSIGTGILNGGQMTIKRTTIHDNYSADGSGAGIFNSGDLAVENSTISNNEAPDGRGAGITTNNGTVRVINSTIVNNKTRYRDAGAGINNYYDDSTDIYLENTIVANNVTGDDETIYNCQGAITSLGHNIDNDDSCNLQASGDQPDVNPELGPLQDNGGPTVTHAPLSGSPAIDGGNDGNCPDTDQRSVSRPLGASCDIGAVESDEEGSQSQAGDVNCDNNLDVVDALFILRYVVGELSDGGTCPLDDPETQLNAAAGDLDDNDTTDVRDALAALLCITGMGNASCDVNATRVQAASVAKNAGSVDLALKQNGQTLSLQLDATDAAVAAGTFELNYDSSRAQLSNCTLSAQGACHEREDGKIYLTFIDIVGLSGTQSIAELTFDSADVAVSEMRVLTLVDSTGRDLTFTISLLDMQADAQTSVDISIHRQFIPLMNR